MAKPTTSHWDAALRVVHYLKSASGSSLFFPSSSQLLLCGSSDLDWACCPDSRRSVIGYAIYLGDSLISWKSKKQVTVSYNSSEAKYRALATITCEVQ